MSSLAEVVTTGMDVCRMTVQDHGSVLSGLFLTGLVGSISHCAGMCGPFVLSQLGARLEAVPVSRMGEWHRISGAMAVPYHLGRLTTYMALGALAAGAVGHLAGGGETLRWVSSVLLGLAAVGVMAAAFPRAMASLFPHWGWEARWSAAVTGRARSLFDRPVGWRGFALGAVLGFIPCGLLYAALSTAASMGGWLAGAFGMAAFTLGTVPALVAVGVAGHVAAGVWRRPALEFSPWLLLANGLVLGGLAGNMMWKIVEGGGTP